MEECYMKTRIILFAAALVLPFAFSCNKETPEKTSEKTPETGKTLTTLKAAPLEGAVDSKTAFVDDVFMWKKNDNINVRSDNANGYTLFKYSGEDTAGGASFDIKSENAEDKIVTGSSSFAVYPGVGARVQDNTLKIDLKQNYTWFDGNVEAPMLAQVTEDGADLQFKHLGGLLKVTYKNLPPKAAKVVLWAPCSLEGKKSYKICSTMNQIHNWVEDQGGFTGETPYAQAYDHSNKYELTENIASATPTQRASQDGLTVYIPLPVGPGENHVYPELKVRLTFADGTTVPGSERTAKNIKIERATIKPMEPIVLAKYTVEVVAGTNGSNATLDGTGTAAKFNQVRGMVWKDNDNLLLLESNGNKVLRQFNKKTKAVTTLVTLGGNAPWQGSIKDGVLYFADKGGNKVRSYNLTSGAVADVTAVSGGPMSVRFSGDDAFVVCRDASVVHKFAGGFSGTKSTFFDCSTLEHDTDTNWPQTIGFDADGNLFVPFSTKSGTSPSGYKVHVVSPSGVLATSIGKGVKSNTNFAALADGSVENATFGAATSDITLGLDGAMYMVDSYAVRRITKGENGWDDAVVTTLLGGGNTYEDCVGALCQLTSTPSALVFDPENPHVFYFFDWKYTLRKVTIE